MRREREREMEREAAAGAGSSSRSTSATTVAKPGAAKPGAAAVKGAGAPCVMGASKRVVGGASAGGAARVPMRVCQPAGDGDEVGVRGMAYRGVGVAGRGASYLDDCTPLSTQVF